MFHHNDIFLMLLMIYMTINLNVLCSLMEHGIFSNVYCCLVVAI